MKTPRARGMVSIPAAAFAGLLFPIVSASAQPTFIGLGSSTKLATDVSADGSIVIGTGANGDFRWTSGTGAVSAIGQKMSADGSVTTGTTTVGDHMEAYRWTQSTGVTTLGVLPFPYDTSSRGVAISGDGSTVVGQSNWQIGEDHGSHAFRWTQSTGMVPAVPTGEDGYFYANQIATATSSDGAAVVSKMRNPGIDSGQSIRWTSAGGYDVLNSDPYSITDALGMSADGSTIVGTMLVHSGFIDKDVWEPFRWTKSEGVVGLGLLPLSPPFPPDSQFLFESLAATAVSADGSVIIGESARARGSLADYNYYNLYGQDTPVDDSSNGFIWTQSGGIRDFRDVLVNDYGLGGQLAGWTTINPYAMSADGRFIVGWGFDNGIQEGFLLDRTLNPPSLTPVPEPSTYGLVGAMALVGVVVLRRRAAGRELRPRSLAFHQIKS